MSTFLKTFESISYSRNVYFPYYAYSNDSISLYIDDELSINSKRNPEKFEETLTLWSENNIKPILCCYQFFKAYEEYC